jgi:hypothetical protein
VQVEPKSPPPYEIPKEVRTEAERPSDHLPLFQGRPQCKRLDCILSILMWRGGRERQTQSQTHTINRKVSEDLSLPQCHARQQSQCLDCIIVRL